MNLDQPSVAIGDPHFVNPHAALQLDLDADDVARMIGRNDAQDLCKRLGLASLDRAAQSIAVFEVFMTFAGTFSLVLVTMFAVVIAHSRHGHDEKGEQNGSCKFAD